MPVHVSVHVDTSVNKHPGAVLDYQFDWGNWLGADTIETSQWSVGTGLTKDSDDNTNSTATVWLSGGTDGTSYQVTNTITTAQGRTESKALTVNVTASGAA